MKLIPLGMVWLFCVPPLTRAEADEADSRAQSLVKQLGSTSFKVREDAAKELIALGAGSRKALEQGCSSTDVEVAERCRKLLPRAYEQYVQQRLPQLLTDRKLPIPDDFPAARRWMSIAGRSEAAGDLYRKVLAQYPEVLIRLTHQPDSLKEKYQKLYSEFNQRLDSAGSNKSEILSITDIALYLFLTSDPGLKLKRGIFEYPPPRFSIVTQTALKNSLQDRTGGEPLQKLFLEYLSHESHFKELQHAIQLVDSMDLKIALPALLKIARDIHTWGPVRGQALRVVGRLGDSMLIPELIPLIDDDTVVATFPFSLTKGTRREVQIRDIALALAIHLSERDAREFGFDRKLQPLQSGDENWSIFGISEDQRESARKKWQSVVNQSKQP